MIYHRKGKKFTRVLSILFIAILFIVCFKMVRHVGSSTVELVPASSARLEENYKTLPAVPNLNKTYRIVIDPGHGGKDPGATGASGAYEKTFNLSLAGRVVDLLEEDPLFEPLLTRSDDQFVELDERAAKANDWNADAMISIHGNTYTDPMTSGTETLYRHEESIPLAQTLQEHLVKGIGLRDRGIKEEQLKVLSKPTMPAVLIEVGYLTNAEDERFLLSNEGQDLAAQAIVDGLKDYFAESQELSLGHQANGESVERSPGTPQSGNQSMEKKVYFNGSAQDGKQVALTFDDGPDAIVTPKILDILKENDIKATFFILGNRAEAHPETVRRIKEEGHAIGNHSWSHPDFTELSMEEAMNQVINTQNELNDIIGYRPSLFRPPYGALDKEQEEYIQNMDLAIVNWSVDTMDWSGLPAPEIMGIIHKQLKPGGIILQHTANGKNHLANTLEALELLIPDLKDQGYSFVTVPDLLHLPESQS
ncbi:N-acetylmuramoyl-L-alanine amidase [Paenibacillus solani]|uniref:Polysaccharide deacetylase n=1 Tax=Paenibacillus solani TaxID=1705565 RepID=A0A0M1P463_9BACL|nr:N-acetylmuramoyl-L-alanine amidase [Paenibacillus solani]KOR89085.1 polysaccharide deacetylase [Paenibacillus solani]